MKNEMMEAIEEHGIDSTSKMLAEYVNQKIASEDVAMQFVLEELEAASQGNEMAKLFATTSGFDEDDYMGAMRHSFEEVDGADGPQQEILNLCIMLYPDQNLMAELRIKTVDNIMKEWKLGKYSAVNDELRLIDIVQQINDLDDGIFANINNDLNGSITQDNDVMILMAYGYARRTVAAGLYLQGVFDRENYMQASKIFKSLQLQTGQSVEFQEEAASQSLELLLSYNSRLTKVMVSKITNVVELDQVNCAYTNNMYFNFDEALDFFEDKNIKTHLEKELSIFKNDLDVNDYKIVENLLENNISSIFESIEEKELNSWMNNLSECTSKENVNSLVGSCILLAFCKYSLIAMPNDTERVLLSKVSNELKKIIYTINNF